MSPGGTVMTIGRSKAKIYGENEVKVTFNDVAGVQEAKDELVEIVEFCTPKKFQRLGGKIPKGCCSSAPRYWQTLLARAVAGEAKVPFSRSMGRNSSRCSSASEPRACAISLRGPIHCPVHCLHRRTGRARQSTRGPTHWSGMTNGQTLNQLLVEMDGFDSRRGVIILAATNRPRSSIQPSCDRVGSTARSSSIGLT